MTLWIGVVCVEKSGLKINHWFLWLLKLGFGTVLLSGSAPAIAQITPDSTLGTESSRLTPGVTVPGGLGDRIEGGAQRGAALFHSFSQFNIRAGQRVYFANPASVEAILSRVTGADPSRILGTLGVEGTASLFLLNPNGILFGREARLDVRGSFGASTGDRFTFSGGEFSAVNPQAPPILNVQVPIGLQLGATQSGTIQTRGQLTAGQHLTFVGRDLDLQGQLQAGGDLSLSATHTLQLRDSATAPAIVSAGRNLLVQGDRLVDLFALNHPLSGLFAAGNLTLRSSNPISADAHFFVGGNLRVEQLSGGTGDLLSLNDPVILAAGDVTLGDYTGASLHVLAGGSVTLGNVAINAPGIPSTTITPRSPNPLFQFLANLPLSDGSSLTIEGDRRPTLDVRAGIDWSRVPGGFPGLTVVDIPPGVATFGPSATSADITVGSFTSLGTPEGADLVLTNQYLANPLLTAPTGITIGAISTSGGGAAGTVTVDARSNLTLNGAVTTVAPAGGNVRLLAREAIALNGFLNTGAAAAGGLSGSIFASAESIAVNGVTLDSSAIGQGGAITLRTTGNLQLSRGSVLTSSGATAGVVSLQGGDIDIRNSQVIVNTAATRQSSAPNGIEIRGRSLTLSDDSLLSTGTLATGEAGNIFLFLSGRTRLDNSLIRSELATGATGSSGSIRITTDLLEGVNNGRLQTVTRGNGDADDIIINAASRVFFNRNDPTNSSATFSGILSSVAPGAVGRGGDILVTSGAVDLVNGAQLSTLVEVGAPQGLQAGNIVLNVNGPTVLDAGQIISEVRSGRTANGGQISIAARTLVLRNGSEIRTQILDGTGNAGNIILEQLQTVSLNRSSIQSGNSGGSGRSGNISITTQALFMNSALVQTSGFSGSVAGNLEINARDRIQMTQGRIATRVQNGGDAENGQIEITTRSLTLSNSSFETTALSGIAGNISLIGSDRISFTQGSSAGSLSPGTAGNLTLTTRQLLLENSRLSSSNGRLGAGGSINVNASSATLNNGRIATETDATTGGNIQLQSLNTLRMSRNSLLSTSAGFRSPGVSSSGGNITIQTNRGQVEAPTTNNSDIIAEATGNGGQVSITGQVNGFQQRQGLSLEELRSDPSNDLSGSGGVRITSFPDEDEIIPPSRGPRQQPDIPPDTFLLQFQSPSDPNRQIVLPVCGGNSATATNPNQFVVSGRGGLPTAPGEPLSVDGVNADLVTPSPIPHTSVPEPAQGSFIPPAAISVDTITEASGWVKTADGRVTLVASGSLQMLPAACPFARTSER